MLRVLIAAAGLVLCGVATAQGTFHGYPCTVDCSGHEAGYAWADRKGIDDPSDCGGNSNSFIEGCQSWAEEQDDWLSYDSDEDDDYSDSDYDSDW